MAKRPPREIWELVRVRVYDRDRGRCQGPYCMELTDFTIELNKCHIDHIKPLSHGGKPIMENERVLCPRCHALRACVSHNGLRAKAISKGLIPPDWRPLVWDG